MDKGGVNCQFILLINSRVSSFIYNFWLRMCQTTRINDVWTQFGWIITSLLVCTTSSISCCNRNFNYLGKKIIKKGMCLCCFELFHFWFYILIKEKNSFKLRTFFLIRKICPSVHTLTTNFLCKNKYNDIIYQDWGKSFCQAFVSKK